jgi:hypothetical protein
MHSDVYDTVFALQSLGDGWSDYLSRVRTLWDGHLNQRTSVVGHNGVGSLQSLNSAGPAGDASSGLVSAGPVGDASSGLVSSGSDVRSGKGTKSGTPTSAQTDIAKPHENGSGKPITQVNNVKVDTQKSQG